MKIKIKQIRNNKDKYNSNLALMRAIKLYVKLISTRTLLNTKMKIQSRYIDSILKTTKCIRKISILLLQQGRRMIKFP